MNRGSSEWHYSIKWKGGDAYGKVPKRIAIARSRGEENNAWPGQEAIARSEIPCFTRNKLRNLKKGSLK